VEYYAPAGRDLYPTERMQTVIDAEEHPRRAHAPEDVTDYRSSDGLPHQRVLTARR